MRVLLKSLPLLLFLAGCATLPEGPKAPLAEREAIAAQDLARGDFVAAAQGFTALAADTQPPERDNYRLQAAEALMGGGLTEQASRMLRQVDIAVLDKPRQTQARLLGARIAIAQRAPERVLELLVEPPPESDKSTSAEYHLLRAQAYALLGNHLETAREFILREPFLEDEGAVLANQQAIWSALSNLSDLALTQLATKPPPDVLSGWMALARIAKVYRLGPKAIEERLAQWRHDYPSHPALASIVDGLLQRSRELIVQPENVALLLPLSGRFAEAGRAVRDGVLAAYYKGPDHQRVHIRIYDVGDRPEQVMTRYAQALQDGAQFVIGPLSKEAVSVLARIPSLGVPTLALNDTGEPAVDQAKLYEFALLPEDEARQTAERAWFDGHSKAAMFVPEGPWGERIAEAFDKRWVELGGTVETTEHYNPQHSDYSGPLKRLLNIAGSDERHNHLENLLGEKLEFVPRRRQDIDFVFLAAFPRQARLIRPQLKFHHAADLPVYATSQLYTGKVEPDQDRDMDGITFGDMPWTLDTTPKPKMLQHYEGQLRRLVALGMDAYDLIPMLKLLAHYPEERFEGATGRLGVDSQHRVRRQLVWAHFSHGVPRTVEAPSPPQE